MSLLTPDVGAPSKQPWGRFRGTSAQGSWEELRPLSGFWAGKAKARGDTRGGTFCKPPAHRRGSGAVCAVCGVARGVQLAVSISTVFSQISWNWWALPGGREPGLHLLGAPRAEGPSLLQAPWAVAREHQFVFGQDSAWSRNLEVSSSLGQCGLLRFADDLGPGSCRVNTARVLDGASQALDLWGPVTGGGGWGWADSLNLH